MSDHNQSQTGVGSTSPRIEIAGIKTYIGQAPPICYDTPSGDVLSDIQPQAPDQLSPEAKISNARVVLRQQAKGGLTIAQAMASLNPLDGSPASPLSPEVLAK